MPCPCAAGAPGIAPGTAQGTTCCAPTGGRAPGRRGGRCVVPLWRRPIGASLRGGVVEAFRRCRRRRGFGAAREGRAADWNPRLRQRANTRFAPTVTQGNKRMNLVGARHAVPLRRRRTRYGAGDGAGHNMLCPYQTEGEHRRLRRRTGSPLQQAVLYGGVEGVDVGLEGDGAG